MEGHHHVLCYVYFKDVVKESIKRGSNL